MTRGEFKPEVVWYPEFRPYYLLKLFFISLPPTRISFYPQARWESYKGYNIINIHCFCTNPTISSIISILTKKSNRKINGNSSFFFFFESLFLCIKLYAPAHTYATPKHSKKYHVERRDFCLHVLFWRILFILVFVAGKFLFLS